MVEPCRRGEQLIASILKLGVATHVIWRHSRPQKYQRSPTGRIRFREERLGARLRLCLAVCAAAASRVLNFSKGISVRYQNDRKVCPLHHARARNILSVFSPSETAQPFPSQLLLSEDSAAWYYKDHLSGWKSRALSPGPILCLRCLGSETKELLYSSRGVAPALTRLCTRQRVCCRRRYNEMGRNLARLELSRDCSSSSLWGCCLRFRSRLWAQTNDILCRWA